jgi:hypothetical protein
MTISRAVGPWVQAFIEERALPSGVLRAGRLLSVDAVLFTAGVVGCPGALPVGFGYAYYLLVRTAADERRDRIGSSGMTGFKWLSNNVLVIFLISVNGLFEVQRRHREGAC